MLAIEFYTRAVEENPLFASAWQHCVYYELAAISAMELKKVEAKALFRKAFMAWRAAVYLDPEEYAKIKNWGGKGKRRLGAPGPENVIA